MAAKSKAPTAEQVEKMAELLKQGMTRAEIAKKLQIKVYWVQKSLIGHPAAPRKAPTTKTWGNCKHRDCMYSIVLESYRACDYCCQRGVPRPHPAAECPGYYRRPKAAQGKEQL